MAGREEVVKGEGYAALVAAYVRHLTAGRRRRPEGSKGVDGPRQQRRDHGVLHGGLSSVARVRPQDWSERAWRSRRSGVAPLKQEVRSKSGVTQNLRKRFHRFAESNVTR